MTRKGSAGRLDGQVTVISHINVTGAINGGRGDTPIAEGKIDACLGLPPVPQDLRARHIGHVVVNSAMDRPWSQYFCCMLAGNREFVRKYPVATKRVVRAILKGIIC